jgi:cell division protease FtsH
MLATPDYSDETARVIDEEVQRILRSQETRCRNLLNANRAALDLVARALLEHETISGEEVGRLIRVAANPGSEPETGSETDSGSGPAATAAAAAADDDPPDTASPAAVSDPASTD